MCFSGGSSGSSVTPAPAPAPPAPAPKETQIGQGRKDNNTDLFGKATGPETRVDRSVALPGPGGGLGM